MDAGGRSNATASPVTKSSSPTPTVALLTGSSRWLPSAAPALLGPAVRWQPTAYSDRVDLDAYVVTHQHEWAWLNELASRRGKLTGAEGDELLDLYQRVATHLSEIRTRSPEPTLVAHLSSMLATARPPSAGTRTLSFDDVTTFFTDTFPAALYRLRAVAVDDGGQRRGRLGDRGVVRVEPQHRVRAHLSDPGQPANRQRLRELLQRISGAQLRAAGVDQQRLADRACLAPGVLILPVSYLLLRTCSTSASSAA